MKKILTIILTLFSLTSALELQKIDTDLYKISINIETDISPVIEESIKIVSDNPDLEIENTTIEGESKNSSDPVLKDLKILDKEFKIIVQIKLNKHLERANLYLTYQLSKTKKLIEKYLPLKFERHEKQKINTKKKAENLNKPKPIKKSHNKKSFEDYIEQFAKWVQNLLKTSNSIWIQLIAVFFLGILMSLTPCIYPMIPITAGILQSYGSKSLFQNFFVSTLYGLGIATTFATFGLIAAFTGHLFGNILMSPIFIIFIILVMAYMGLSMFGIFEMYIPKFMQKNISIKKTDNSKSLRNIFAPFLLGVITGSVASPCLTPGLAFLLTLVATIGNKFLGFTLLFTAGIGLSLPLLIIGTFSSSLNVLPRAGTWMLEIKKIFGLILFGMCFYFLSPIIPLNFLLMLISIFCFTMGIYYFYSINKKTDAKKIQIFKNLFGAIFIIISIGLAVKSIQETCFPNVTELNEDSLWHRDLETALNEAKLMNQNLLVDIGGEFCSICKAIDKKIFAVEKVQEELKKIVALKINASQQIDSYNFFKERFKVIGVPTILLLTHDLKLIKRWGSELYNITPEQFIEELNT
jgi:thioredoxin:protein disulfide reductase